MEDSVTFYFDVLAFDRQLRFPGFHDHAHIDIYAYHVSLKHRCLTHPDSLSSGCILGTLTSASYSLWQETSLWHLWSGLGLLSSNAGSSNGPSRRYIASFGNDLFTYPFLKERSLQSVYLRKLFAQLPKLFQLSLSTSCLYLAAYLTFRSVIFGAFVSLPFAKPFIHNFVRSRLWGLSLSIYFRLAALNLASTLLWTFSEVAFGVRASMVSRYCSRDTLKVMLTFHDSQFPLPNSLTNLLSVS